MHKWFTQKLNEMIGLSQYCDFPLLQAHFVLTKSAVDELYHAGDAENDSLKRILPLLIQQAHSKNEQDAAMHLEHALAALEQPKPTAANVVHLNLPSHRHKRSGSTHN